MKKIFILLLAITSLLGCDTDDSYSTRCEELLNHFRMEVLYTELTYDQAIDSAIIREIYEDYYDAGTDHGCVVRDKYTELNFLR